MINIDDSSHELNDLLLDAVKVLVVLNKLADDDFQAYMIEYCVKSVFDGTNVFSQALAYFNDNQIDTSSYNHTDDTFKLDNEMALIIKNFLADDYKHAYANRPPNTSIEFEWARMFTFVYAIKVMIMNQDKERKIAHAR